MSSLRERFPPQGLPAAAEPVVNQIQSGTLAARPAAGTADDYYWATDILTLFRDTGAAWEVVGGQWYAREIHGIFPPQGNSFVIETVGRVLYTPFQIEKTCTVDGVISYHGGVAAGNQYVALYDSVAFAPVNRLAVSVSTALLGVNRRQFTAFAAAYQVTPGIYYAAIELDNNTDVLMASLASALIGPGAVGHGIPWYEEALGAYQIPPAVATPAAVTTATYTRHAFLTLRVSAIP